jgi:sugar phosphate permease
LPHRCKQRSTGATLVACGVHLAKRGQHAAALTAGASGALILTLAFFLLRFFVQGLLTHAAMTAMGRYFSAERGRAVSIAALGHVTGEAVLPLMAVMTLVQRDERSSCTATEYAGW